MKIRLGTRASELATTQSGHVAEMLRAHGHDVELITITTDGDVAKGSLSELGGVGVFAARLRQALLERQCDIAVHSFKDLPTAPVPGLEVAAVPPREDTTDVLCARDGLTLDALPEAATIGTGSPRRAAQIRELRPDAILVDIRGNVGTRLSRISADDCDAVVLAAAGLRRLGREDAITDTLPILPAPSQGALAVECRTTDVTGELGAALRLIDDAATRAAATAERAVLAELEAGCAAPVGALAIVEGAVISLRAAVISVDGSKRVETMLMGSCENAAELGVRVAQTLLKNGAAKVADLSAAKSARTHDEVRLWAGAGASGELGGVSIFWPRTDDAYAEALREAGAMVTCLPLTSVEVNTGAVVKVRETLSTMTSGWLVCTSPRAVDVLGLRQMPEGVKVAAVGASTARALMAVGVPIHLVPTGVGGQALVEEFPAPDFDGETVLLPVSTKAAPTVTEGLSALGYHVVGFPIYTPQAVKIDMGMHKALADHRFDLAVVSAGSVAEALASHTVDIPVVAFGTPSATRAQELGLTVAATSTAISPTAIVEACIEAAKGLA